MGIVIILGHRLSVSWLLWFLFEILLFLLVLIYNVFVQVQSIPNSPEIISQIVDLWCQNWRFLFWVQKIKLFGAYEFMDAILYIAEFLLI